MGYFADKDILAEKDLSENAATIKSFEYPLSGRELEKKIHIS